jgi:hypothetical protein
MQGSNDNTSENRVDQHREVSETLRRCIMVQLAFCLFCVLTISSGDSALLVAAEKVQVPFADVPISLRAFVLVAPSILVALSIYLHVFEHERLQLEATLDSLQGRHDAILPAPL